VQCIRHPAHLPSKEKVGVLRVTGPIALAVVGELFLASGRFAHGFAVVGSRSMFPFRLGFSRAAYLPNLAPGHRVENKTIGSERWPKIKEGERAVPLA
jgi:hypothetical protein